MPNEFTLVAPCFFGTESTLSFEVRRLGAQNVQVTDGRVAFSGGAEMIAAANLNLRTAERVLLLLRTFPASTFDELFDGVNAIPWEELIPADAQFPVKGSSLSSQLSSVPACQSIVKKAVVKRLQAGHKTASLNGLKCTRLVIAHRLSTIRQCDRILVLDGGKIIESGTYDELIARNGFFAELVSRQRLDADGE